MTMPENEKQPKQRDSGPDAGGIQDDGTPMYRSLAATIAAVTIPAATVAKPVAIAWANHHFSQKHGKPEDPAQQPQQPEED
jgi:hypothetical protein